MSRTVVNFFLDATLLLLLAMLAATAVVVQYVFPPGTSSAGWMLWGYSYNAWSRMHFGLTCVFALGVLVHVMLHWTWVCGVVFGKLLRRKDRLADLDDGIRTLYGVATLITILVLIGIFVAAANLAIEPPSAGASP